MANQSIVARESFASAYSAEQFATAHRSAQVPGPFLISYISTNYLRRVFASARALLA